MALCLCLWHCVYAYGTFKEIGICMRILTCTKSYEDSNFFLIPS